MNKQLAISAVSKFALGLVCMGLLLFLPAGTWHYPRGWLLMALLFIPMFAAGLVMMARSPALLRSRLRMNEDQPEQKRVIRLSALMFVGSFVVAGLDFRFGWTHLPDLVCLCGSLTFLLGYALFAQVLRENAWLSRTVQVQEGQTLVDTGLYAIVRHPMYLATLVLFLSMPLVLGSWVSLAFFLPYPFLLAARIRGEEQLLEQELKGYTAYKTRVPFRLIPYIW